MTRLYSPLTRRVACAKHAHDIGVCAMTASFDFSRNTVLAMSVVAGLSVTAVAAPVTISSEFDQTHETAGFSGVMAELASPILAGLGSHKTPTATPTATPGDHGKLIGDLGAAFRSFGDRKSSPSIGMLRFNPELTGSNPAVYYGNSSSYSGAIGAPLPRDMGDRPNPTVVPIPLPTGGLLTLAGLGLIGGRRIRSVS